MSKSTQALFFERLEGGLEGTPGPFSLNVDHAFANDGILRVFHKGTFDVAVALHFHFDDGYASFYVPTREAPSAPLIGDREDGKSFPYVLFDEIESRVLSAIFKQLEAPNAR